MAAVAGLLDLNEPMFGLSKVEVVQSIDPTKLQVSLDDCDLLCSATGYARPPARGLTVLAGNAVLEHPVASRSCPPLP